MVFPIFFGLLFFSKAKISDLLGTPAAPMYLFKIEIGNHNQRTDFRRGYGTRVAIFYLNFSVFMHEVQNKC